MEFSFDIIIPAYNCADKIGKMLNSILNQTYSSYNVYIVDDGSTDDTVKFCQSYAEKNSNVFIISQSNQGPSIARKTGFCKADAEYVFFLDADDYIGKDCFSSINKTLRETNADVLEFGFQKVDLRGRELPSKQLVPESVPQNCLKHFVIQKNTTNYLWNKVFKRNIIKETYFEPLFYSEDALLLANIYTNCHNHVIIPDVFYYYVIHSGSACNNITSIKKLDILKAYERITELTKIHSPEVVNFSAVNACAYTAKVYGALNYGKILTPEIKNEIVTFFKRNYKVLKGDRKEAYKYSSIERKLSIELFRVSPMLYFIAFAWTMK